MRNFIVGAALLVGMTAAEAPAAEVYKCNGPNGTVYSQQPCSPNAAPVSVRYTRAATAVDGAADPRDAIAKSTAKSDIGIRERNCLASANSRIYGQSNARVAEYRNQISNLNRSVASANNNLAGATYEAGLRQQISSLNQSIASERASADAQMTAARTQCASERQEAERAIDER